MRDLIAKRRDTARYIADDPWDITVRRRGLTPDDPETSWSFTGRIAPAGTRSIGSERMAAAMGGEAPVGRFSFVLISPYDQPAMTARDEVTAMQGDIERNFRVIFSTQYSYKHEAILDERE